MPRCGCAEDRWQGLWMPGRHQAASCISFVRSRLSRSSGVRTSRTRYCACEGCRGCEDTLTRPLNIRLVDSADAADPWTCVCARQGRYRLGTMSVFRAILFWKLHRDVEMRAELLSARFSWPTALELRRGKAVKVNMALSALTSACATKCILLLPPWCTAVRIRCQF